MKARIKRIDVSTLAPLILFSVFSLCVITVLLTGAKIYKSSSERDRNDYDRRTVSQYLTTRIRQSDRDGGYYIGEFNSSSPQDQGSTFFSCLEISGERYHTRIYCHNGYLCELLTLEGAEFEPADGERIIEAKSVEFAIEENTIKVNIEYSDGRKEVLNILIRSERETIE